MYLKDKKGKANDKGQLRATVAGEIAYDEVLGRISKEKPDPIDMSKLNSATMNPDSEVSADLITGKDLEFRRKQRDKTYFTDERMEHIGSGVGDIVVGTGTAIGGGTIFASSVGVDYVSFGTAIVPSTGAKVLGATGVVVGTNKFVSGIGKVFNAIYGREPNSTINPIKDGLLKINPTGDARDFYNALEIATEVGVGQLAPYAIGVNKKDTVYGTEGYRNYLSGNSRLQFNQPKNPKYQPLRNEDQILNGRVYSGHALDRMQDRGIPISVVEETIKYGKKSSSYSGRIQYYDAKNNITVITEVNGKVVMTRVGK